MLVMSVVKHFLPEKNLQYTIEYTQERNRTRVILVENHILRAKI